MKAIELRIGNLVDVNGVITEVLSVDSNTINECMEMWMDGITLEKVLPIPLTEEWLVKSGFYKETTDGTHNEKFEWLKIKRDKNSYCFIFENYQVDIPDIKLEFVHQFQNLYFALTGNELQIK